MAVSRTFTLREQLPAWSPLTFGGAVRAARALADRSAIHRLEAHLSEAFAAPSVLLTGSGTQALTLALGMGRNPGARIALPAFGCYDLATAAVGAGSEVILYDLDPDTLGPDPASLRRALELGAECIVMVHLFGHPVDWDAIATECERGGALVVEDAAQGTGGSWKGRRLGSLGPRSILSFGRGKGWTGIGGGALLLRDGEEKHPLPALPFSPFSSLPAWMVKTFGQWALGRPALYGLPQRVPFLRLGMTEYHPPTVPTAIPAPAAELVLATAPLQEPEARARRAAGHRFAEILAEAGGEQLRTPALPLGGTTGMLRFPVIANRSEAVTILRSPEGRRLGIQRSYPLPLHMLDPLRPNLYGRSDFPGAEELARSLFTLPTHSRLQERDRREIELLLRRAALG